MSKNPPTVSGNIIDRAIEYVAPRWAMQRYAARTQLALVGGYNGARVDRAALARYNPVPGSPESDISGDLPMLRSRSRDQMRNAPVAVGALNTATNHVVGTGLSYTPAIDGKFLGLTEAEVATWQEDVKRRFEAWAHSPDCDLSRTLTFYGIQELAFRSMLESGDSFVLTPHVQRAGRKRLVLQLIEADRVCNPDGKANTDTMIDGVEISPETGEPLTYHVAKRHPGSFKGRNEWTPYPARGSNSGRRNVLHIFKPLRPEQRRGVPWIAPVIEPLKQLGTYTEAELRAAVTSAIWSVFVKMDPKAFDEMFDDDAQDAIIKKGLEWSGEMQSGKAVNLLPGESVEAPAPGRPNALFDPFVSSILRQVGIALELPFEVLIMSFQSSYSAARASLLMAWKFFRNRRDMLITTLCQPVVDLWLSEEIAAGRIAAPGFFADEVYRAAWCKALWIGDAPGSIDPDKEVKAAKGRIDLGISTKDAESIAFDGQPWFPKHAQRVREINAEKKDRIYVAPAGSGNAKPDASAGEDDEEGDPSGNSEVASTA